MSLTIRKLVSQDCVVIAEAFTRQAWNKPIEKYKGYLADMADECRHVLIAEKDSDFAGYLTIVWASPYPPFRDRLIPEITDLNVLIKFQRRGVATRLLDEAELMIGQRSNVAGIRVGLTADYGAAQCLYVQRGYAPDAFGLSYRYRQSHYGEQVTVDDDLTLGLIKQVRG